MNNDISYFSILPNEVILNIFKFLPKRILMVNCARVCKRWNRITLDQCLWMNVDLVGQVVDVSTLKKVILYGVEDLRLCAAEIRSQDSNLLPENCHINSCKIRHLHLDLTSLTSQVLEDLLSICSYLEYFNVSDGIVPLTDTILKYIANNRKLCELLINHTQGITPIGLLKILKNCTMLENVEIAGDFLGVKAMDVLSCNIPNSVTSLNLYGNGIVENHHVKNIIQRCPQLTKFNLGKCRNLTSNIIDFVVEDLPNLQNLNISYCTLISLSQLFLLKHVNNLKYLYILHIPKASALGLQETLKKVKIYYDVDDTISNWLLM